MIENDERSAYRSDKQEPQTIDGESGTLIDTPPARRIDLSNLRDVRLELAALYRRVDAGQIDSRDGSRRAFILKTIHDVIVSGELEKRLDELEERVPAGISNRLLESRTH